MNILLTRLQNIGDMLAFIPALRYLRKQLPNAHITLLTKHPGGVEIAKSCPYIDNIVQVTGHGLKAKWHLIKTLRKLKIDYFIISPQDMGRVPWALAGGAKKIIAYPKVLNNQIWKREKLPSFIHLPLQYNPQQTEVENSMRLIQALLTDQNNKTRYTTQDLQLDFSWIKNETHQKAKQILQKRNIKGPYLISAPVTPKRPAKNWTDENFLKIYKKAHEQWQLPIILIGGNEEKEMMKTWPQQLGSWCHLIAGETNILESASLIQQASLFLGIDSGPAFMATAVKTPAIVLFGPADFERWQAPPNSSGRKHIFHRRPCNPCRYDICPYDQTCMDDITIDEVWTAMEDCHNEHQDRFHAK